MKKLFAFMKRNYKILTVVVLIAVALWGFSTKKFADPNKDKLMLQVMTYVLERGHYDPIEFDDSFSEKLFYDFITAADPFKGFFTQPDIDKLEAYKYSLDDQIKNTDITFFNHFYLMLTQRIAFAEQHFKEIVKEPFDFEKPEVFNADYEQKPFVSDEASLKDRWRLQLKFSALSNYHDLVEERQKKLANGEEAKSLEEIEAEARETVTKNMQDFFSSMNERRREDWFYNYLSLVAEAFDPHTSYLSPQDKDAFDTGMSGKYFGIGARLQKKEGDITIIELISGGPAWRDQELEVGDKIVKVAQGDEEPVNVVGMRLDDAIKLIKGPENTEVRLTVKRMDGSQKVISIVREEIELEETYLKTSLIKDGDATFGIINLPKFYVDFDNPKARNAAEDMKQELERLKASGAEGVIIDLRNNGGGSLQTVVEMGGLFIESGPIVQVRSSGGKRSVLADKDPSITWDGPLVILVNELSASASEILAAAMQDYKRGIVIGSKQTYGKGTVQQIYGLADILNDNSVGDIGALKLTIQKFYRVDGSSTQLEGVKSDIIVPDRYSYIDIGEKDSENPLPWDKIEPAKYKPWDAYKNLNQVIKRSQERIANRPQTKLLDEQARWIQFQRDDNEIPLKYELYASKIADNEKAIEKFKSLDSYTYNLDYKSLPYEVKLFESDSTLQLKRERWHKDLNKDMVIAEAVDVLKDIKKYAQNRPLAAVKD
jgi:carboxyl-terminal processing protease